MGIIFGFLGSRFGAAIGLFVFAFAAGAFAQHSISDQAHARALLEAKQQADALRTLADRREQERLAAQAEADAAALYIEDLANADQSGSDNCLSLERVRRLSAR